MYLKIIFLIYIYQKDLTLNNLNGWYAIKANQTKSYIFNTYV